MKFTERLSKIPENHFEIVNITTDGDISLCVNFDECQAEFFEKRHIEILVAALEDAFYRLRPDLRPQ